MTGHREADWGPGISAVGSQSRNRTDLGPVLPILPKTHPFSFLWDELHREMCQRHRVCAELWPGHRSPGCRGAHPQRRNSLFPTRGSERELSSCSKIAGSLRVEERPEEPRKTLFPSRGCPRPVVLSSPCFLSWLLKREARTAS